MNRSDTEKDEQANTAEEPRKPGKRRGDLFSFLVSWIA
jgi:hypothetical protein